MTPGFQVTAVHLFDTLALNQLTVVATAFWDINQTTEFTMTGSEFYPEGLLIASSVDKM